MICKMRKPNHAELQIQNRRVEGQEAEQLKVYSIDARQSMFLNQCVNVNRKMASPAEEATDGDSRSNTSAAPVYEIGTAANCDGTTPDPHSQLVQRNLARTPCRVLAAT